MSLPVFITLLVAMLLGGVFLSIEVVTQRHRPEDSSLGFGIVLTGFAVLLVGTLTELFA